MNLAENIYRLRTQRNMSQVELADELGVSRQSVSKWETGTAVPELDKLVKMCCLFGVSLDELVGENIPTQSPPQLQDTPSDPPPPTNGYWAGFILLACALLSFLLRGLTGFVALGIPLIVCGILCLVLKRYRWLWCGWVLLFWIINWLPKPSLAITPFWTLVGNMVFPNFTATALYNFIIALVSNAFIVLLSVLTLRSYLPAAIRYVTTHKTNLLLGWLFILIPSFAGTILTTIIAYRFVREQFSLDWYYRVLFYLEWIHFGTVLTMIIFTVARLRAPRKE